MQYIKDFLNEFPNFKIIKNTTDKIILSGIFKKFLEYNGRYIFKEILLKIEISTDYPISLPKIYDTKNILPENYHKNPDKSLCLGTEVEIRKILFPDYSLKIWLEKCVQPFIFSSLYFEKYGSFIFGESEHGSKGEINSIKDFLGFSDLRETFLFTNFILFRKYRRKLFRKKRKKKKYDCNFCNICNKKDFKCNYFSKLEKLNLYFNNEVLKYLKSVVANLELEEKNYARYKK